MRFRRGRRWIHSRSLRCKLHNSMWNPTDFSSAGEGAYYLNLILCSLSNKLKSIVRYTHLCPRPPYMISRRVRSSLPAPGVVLLRVRLTDWRSKSETRLSDAASPLRIHLFQTLLTYLRVSHVLDWAKRNMLSWFELFSSKMIFLYNQKS